MLGRRDVSSAPADLSGSLDADERDKLLAELAALDEQKAKLRSKRGRLDPATRRKARLQAAGVCRGHASSCATATWWKP